MIGRQVVDALRARGDEVTVLSRSAPGHRALGRPDGGAAAARGARGPRRRRPPARRERRAALDRRGEAAHPRVARARHAESRRGPRAASADASGRARSCRCRRSASTARAATSASTSRGPRATTSSPRWSRPGRRRPRKAEELGVRVAIPRTGVVLAEGGGALEKMLPPFKLGVGGPVAGGRQYVPWVHLDDVVGGLLFLLDGGSGHLQPDGAGAGHEQGALEGARPRPAPARGRAGAGARAQGALRRDGPDRHDRRARGAEAAARGGLLVQAAGPRRRAPGGGRLSPRVAALLGALTIAFSAILVKASDVAPPTSAFFRCFYAVPVLWLLARGDAAHGRASGGSRTPRASCSPSTSSRGTTRSSTSAPGSPRCSATSRSSSSA